MNSILGNDDTKSNRHREGREKSIDPLNTLNIPLRYVLSYKVDNEATNLIMRCWITERGRESVIVFFNPF
jgi:hypothetical protein